MGRVGEGRCLTEGSVVNVERSLFTVRYSVFTVHCSLFTVHCSLFRVHFDGLRLARRTWFVRNSAIDYSFDEG